MSDTVLSNKDSILQCQYFVARKKRQCRMSVRPGRKYCGEHEPEPKTPNGKDDTRIPCPNDPKHTCFVSKLAKHLTVCNARPTVLPPYIIHNVNNHMTAVRSKRKTLAETPWEDIQTVINKVNALYEKHIAGKVELPSDREIHPAIVDEYVESGRTQSSLRHLQQTSMLMQLAEDNGLVADGTCYVEMGAGKGRLAYYIGSAWCSSSSPTRSSSRVLLVERAAPRHKRDNKLTSSRTRLRADLAHLVLHNVNDVQQCSAVVGFAKHLCGVATDFAVRCMTAEGVLSKTRGGVLATCCHHQCQIAAYVGAQHLYDLGITEEDLNIMFGIVSWATCGDGCSRERRKQIADKETKGNYIKMEDSDVNNADMKVNNTDMKVNNTDMKVNNTDMEVNNTEMKVNNAESKVNNMDFKDNILESDIKDVETRSETGRRAKLLIDWGRVLFIRSRGLNAWLCQYVGPDISPENICIIITPQNKT